MTLEAGQIVDNRYRVVRMLGQGGMGAVYRAWDTRLKRPVALKEMVPQPGLEPELLAQLHQQFEREAQVLATLSHPNLVRVTDYFAWEERQYLVMDFVEGESLAERMQAQGPRVEAEILHWASQLLDALAYCHARGVIHRDVKPQNIIITPEEDAVLVDFGLVKLWDPNDPHTRTIMRGAGSPQYAPPEQYDMGMGHTDPRSDVYSLGATLYHAATGQSPPTATQRMANPASFVPPRQVNAALGTQTEATILRAMNVEMEKRFQSAKEMTQALTPAPASPPTRHLPPRPTATAPAAQAKPASPRRGGTAAVPSAPQSPRRRARVGVWAGIAAAVAACLVLGTLGAFVLYRITRPGSTPEVVEVTATSSPTTAPDTTPTPPTGAVTVHLAPDGSGDYPSLEAAIDAVPPGSTLVLAAGTFRLESGLGIDKALNLVGAGMDQTEIVSAAEGYVVRFGGDGALTAEDLAFRHEGTAAADVVVVEGGAATFIRCRFTGAIHEEGGAGRAGLRLLGSTTASVQDCAAVENDLDGIRLEGQSQATLEDNICSANSDYGIRYSDDAGGEARGNECAENGLHGIGVGDRAQPTLEGNTCRDNTQVGIRYSGTAGGAARMNRCTSNGLHGIDVSDEASPTLQGNMCTDNGEVGIRFTDEAAGLALRNECARNELHGIDVEGQARPTLERNTCVDNAEVGIRFADDAAGLARANECSRNGLHGIAVRDQAAPTLEANLCNSNAEAGIAYFDTAGGVARLNECTQNEWGIYVAETANPTLQDNTPVDNAASDVDDRRP
jgi:parallel beta-helix repeat protein